MSRLLSLPLLVAVAAAAVLACSSGGSSSSSAGPGATNGSAPTIKDFVLTTATLTVGKDAELNGSMTIEDLDGDLASASGEVVFPDGKIAPTQEVNLSPSAKSVAVMYKIPALPVPLAGQYTISVQAKDAAGNQSAKASVSLTAK